MLRILMLLFNTYFSQKKILTDIYMDKKNNKYIFLAYYVSENYINNNEKIIYDIL